MAWGWEDSDNAHREVYGQEHHEGKLSHELIAGAASFAGMKAWEDHQRSQGKTVNHAFAKEAIAALVGAEVDKLAETKGMDEADKIRAHHHAKKNAEQMYDEHYLQGHDRNERFNRFDGPNGGPGYYGGGGGPGGGYGGPGGPGGYGGPGGPGGYGGPGGPGGYGGPGGPGGYGGPGGPGGYGGPGGPGGPGGRW